MEKKIRARNRETNKKFTLTEFVLKLIRLTRDSKINLTKDDVYNYIANNYSNNKATQRKIYMIYSQSGLVNHHTDEFKRVYFTFERGFI